MPLPASSGTGEVFIFPPPQHGLMIRFEVNPLHPTGPMESTYSYDPKTIVVLDDAGNRIDLSAAQHKRVKFIARRNPHPTNNLLASPMEITKLLLLPVEAQPGDAVEELNQEEKKEAEQMQKLQAQWQKSREQEAKKRTEQDAAARAQAKLQENLRRQMAQKQEESRRAAAGEQAEKLAINQQNQQAVRARNAQLAAKIVRSKAKIEAEDIAPTGSAVKYAVSPHALHLAAATLKGSRSVILMDGVPGPVFNELIWVKGPRFNRIDRMRHYQNTRGGEPDMKVRNAPVIFSDDGTRFAYVGRQGNQYVVMLDGKEFARGPYGPSAVENLCFLPGSNRLAYIVKVPEPRDHQVEYFRGTRLVVEGDENPPVLSLAQVPISFSSDGQHYAYVGEFPPVTNRSWEHAYHLVVDGKVDPVAYSAPGFQINRYMEGNVAPLSPAIPNTCSQSAVSKLPSHRAGKVSW